MGRGEPAVLPLSFLSSGHKAVVEKVYGGLGCVRRLAGLGLIEGAVVRVVRNDRGPLIVALGEARLALGLGMAQKIIVRELK